VFTRPSSAALAQLRRPALQQPRPASRVRLIRVAAAPVDVGREQPLQRGFAHGRLPRPGLRVLREAALQRFHQINELGWLGDRTRRCRQFRRLRLDQLAQRILMASRKLAGSNAPDRRSMMVLAIATISGSASPFALGPNSARRTSSAERSVDITRPAREVQRARALPARDRDASKPDFVAVGHRLPDDPERLRRQLAVGVDVVGSAADLAVRKVV
jgi:hypothetical protein